jgi:uncharacterized protein involved in oxidation of intracellular sulfur
MLREELMKLGIIINTNNAEAAWNALRLGVTALEAGHKISVFLMGGGVEIEQITDKKFDVASLLKRFATQNVSFLACRTCMRLRHQEETGTVFKSSLTDLVRIIEESDKVVSFG